MSDEKAQSVRLVGEGGSEIEMDLPLAAVYIEQINKGTLVPADEKAAEKLAGAGVLQGSGAATAERLKSIDAREESIAAKEAELAAREAALDAAAADTSTDGAKDDGSNEPSSQAPAADDDSGKPAPKGKGA